MQLFDVQFVTSQVMKLTLALLPSRFPTWAFIEANKNNYFGSWQSNFKVSTAQKIEFPINDFFSKYDQIRRKLYQYPKNILTELTV